LDFLSSWSCLLPLFFGLAWLFFLSRESVVVLVIVFLACIPQTMHALDVKSTVVNSLSFNLYTPLEFYLFFSVFYNHVENEKNRLLLKITAVVYTIASLFFVSYFDISRKFIAEWVALSNIIYTAWILIIFFEQYAYSNHKSLDFQDYFFWYILGLLFYAPCTSMIFSMWKYIHQDHNSLLMIVHAIFNINMYILFTVGFYKEYSLKRSAWV
jgi:hypothetical protein